jgi:hypothetical protein
MSDEFSDSGFIEVWISDHSSLEEYGEVTAIGLYPAAIWGFKGKDIFGVCPIIDARANITEPSILSLAARRKGIARCDCARSAKGEVVIGCVREALPRSEIR